MTYGLDGWYWGNLLLGGVLGMLIVDPLTGAMYKPDTEFINERLSSRNMSSITTPQLNIIDLCSVEGELNGRLTRIDQ